jgi:D-alanine-D-alanine ligase
VTGRLRVGIFAGGRSAEHEVSVASADSVLRAIDRDRFEPYVVYIDREGRWHLPTGPAPELGERPLSELLGAATPAEQTSRLRMHADLPVPIEADRPSLAPRAVLRSLAEAIDIAFLVLHGPFGEDGTLQGFLEMAGVPYTGAGVLASAVAMDKVIFKDLMRGHGLPVVDYAWFRRSAWRAAPTRVLEEVARRVGERSVVKPARLGSSVGMTLVHGPDELPGALDEAFRYDGKVIVEAYVAGARELECGVLGNDRPVVFEPGEVRSHHEWYDYESKYTAGLADVLPRADVDPSLAELLKRTALAAYMAVDCSGFARVDFLVADGAVYLSEMNTIPGFTATSMFPKQAELAGIGFGELVERIIDLGLAQAAEGRTPGAADSPRDERDATDEEANP